MQLRFTPYAYAKIQHLRDKGGTEVAGYGICERELLLVTDFRMVPQECSVAFVEMDGEGMLDLMAEYKAKGLNMEQVGRIWIHTHPGNSAKPSGTDENTFKSLWGDCSWSVMAILAKGGDTYARLQYQSRPPEFLKAHSLQSVTMEWAIDYDEPFQGSDKESWDAEYEACWKQYTPPAPKIGFQPSGDGAAFRRYRPEFSESRWWEKKAEDVQEAYQKHWWEEDGKIWDGDTYVPSVDLPPFEETLICKDCGEEWPYFEGGKMKLETCPFCKSQRVDFTPPRHRQRKRKRRKA